MTQAKRFANYKYTRYYDTSRIVSISWVHLDKNYQKVSSNYCIIKPDNFNIPDEATKIHGISDEYANQYGVSIADLIRIFKYSAVGSQTLVSHNIRFDKSILLSELHRYNEFDLLDKVASMDEYCTMMKGKKMMKTKKWPKLAELYQNLFDKEMEGAHNALYDTEHCTDCFIKMHPVVDYTAPLKE